MSSILQKDNLLLRRTAEEVPKDAIRTPKIRTTVAHMKKALAGEPDGVAIAAPQIGALLRIFVVSGKVFSLVKENDRGAGGDTSEEAGQAQAPSVPDMVFINPRFTKLSRKKVLVDEGCLSVRHWYGKVMRAEKATIQAYDERGERFERGASGLLSQIFQHEMDHLDGILFTDKATNLQEILPDEQKHEKRT